MGEGVIKTNYYNMYVIKSNYYYMHVAKSNYYYMHVAKSNYYLQCVLRRVIISVLLRIINTICALLKLIITI